MICPGLRVFHEITSKPASMPLTSMYPSLNQPVPWQHNFRPELGLDSSGPRSMASRRVCCGVHNNPGRHLSVSTFSVENPVAGLPSAC